MCEKPQTPCISVEWWIRGVPPCLQDKPILCASQQPWKGSITISCSVSGNAVALQCLEDQLVGVYILNQTFQFSEIKSHLKHLKSVADLSWPSSMSFFSLSRDVQHRNSGCAETSNVWKNILKCYFILVCKYK